MKKRSFKPFALLRCLYGRTCIGTKIMLVFFIVTLCVVVIVSSFLYFEATKMIEKEMQATMLGMLNQTAISTSSVFNRVEETCFRMYTGLNLRAVFQQEPENYPYWQQVEDYYMLFDIYSANMANPYINGINMYFANQGFYVDMQWAFSSFEDAMDLPWYDEIAGKSGFQWVSYHDPRKKNNASTFTISCIQTVQWADSEVGYIEVMLNQKYLTEILTNMRGSLNSEFYALSNEGMVIAASDDSTLGERFAYAHQTEQLFEERSSALRFNDDGQVLRILVSTLSDEIEFVAIVPDKVFLVHTYDFVAFAVILCGIVLIIAMLLARALSRSIIGRIAKLSQFMQSVSIEGNALAEESFNDELTTLVRACNNMLLMTRRLIREVYEVKLAKEEARLRLLQAQINPHFLYNTLDTINWMANRRKAYDISKITRLLAEFFRKALSNGEDIVTIRSEIMHVRTYLEILQLRYGNEIDFSFEVDKEIMAQKTVKLILQPIVENAVLHGLMEKDDPSGLVFIRGEQRDGAVVLTVVDDGVGISPDMLERLQHDAVVASDIGGYGLRNVNERIQLNFGAAYGLYITSKLGHGTSVEIRLPFLKAESTSRYGE